MRPVHHRHHPGWMNRALVQDVPMTSSRRVATALVSTRPPVIMAACQRAGPVPAAVGSSVRDPPWRAARCRHRGRRNAAALRGRRQTGDRRIRRRRDGVYVAGRCSHRGPIASATGAPRSRVRPSVPLNERERTHAIHGRRPLAAMDDRRCAAALCPRTAAGLSVAAGPRDRVPAERRRAAHRDDGDQSGGHTGPFGIGFHP